MNTLRKVIKEHTKIIKDFLYSFVAYALPTIVLQFIIQPLIADRVSSESNGLFIALFNVLKLLTGMLIMPLANLRLLKKNETEKERDLNSFFNFLFLIIVSLSVIFGTVLNSSYRHFEFTTGNMISFATILLLMSVHDYYMIAYRIILDYKKIVIDNIAIVIGYGVGTVAFLLTGLWEIIFIIGYLFGTVYVLATTSLWKSIPKARISKRNSVVKEYSELSVSALLTNASTYCDRLIIYPVLGGYDVSVYNAAAIVSKAISVLSAPLRNVLLSYIMDQDGLNINKKKLKKILFVYSAVFILLFCVFYLFSIIACNFLYPQYAVEARHYIPIIILAIMIETTGAIMNIALLRFAAAKVQTINSAIKLATYLLAIALFAVVFKMGLIGFCLSILLADLMFTTAVVLGLKNITNRRK